ncbi:amidase [Lysinibacillus yapensis]|uniref:Amidase n=1 Tax=Ureibacillus yapensis TaxID=2304605 RepID=A0A396SB72_9BACL|nr:amidase [Lysinibacillus yapensis]RHW38611.1 amidase [Lysinibacillus yapensis]
MKKLIVAVLLAATLLAGGTNNKALALGQEVEATWLWNLWSIVSNEMQVLAFLEEKSLNKVYLQIDQDISMGVYRSFIEKASAKGIQVYALDGSPQWVAPNGSTGQNRLMTWLNQYQKASTAIQKFKGVHLDVEPYIYSGWATNQAETIKSYQSLLLNAKNSTQAMGLPLEADMPFWFDGISYKNNYGKGLLAEWVIANTNSVTIMAYRDNATQIIELVKNEINMAKKHTKPLVVGVETDFSYEGNNISFFEEGETYMKGELEAVKNYYSSFSSFNGIAVHHVDSWMKMKP